MKCIDCSSEHLKNHGNRGKKVRVMCKDCGKLFTVFKKDWYEHLDGKEFKGSQSFTETPNGASAEGYANDIDEFLKRFDLERWEVVTWEIVNGNWDTTYNDREQDLKFEKDLEGKQVMTGTAKRRGAKTKTNYKHHFKVKFKPRQDLTSTERFKKELIREIKNYSPIVHKIKKVKLSGNMLEIIIPDLHLGKLGWSRETGEPNYDTKIACKRFNDAVDAMLEKALKFSEMERIVFVVGNDWFNSDKDYPFPSTTSGTPQHSDERWQKVYTTGRKLASDTIDKLASIAPVDVIAVQGNHAFQKEFYLADSLECKYENHKHVNIDNRPTARKYYRWGNGLIGFEHGRPSDAGMKRIQTLMQHEVPRLWAETIYHEWHMGDVHHHKKAVITDEEDYQGIILRWIRTLMFNDEWEAKKGYKSQKGAHAFIWNKERGVDAEIRFNG